MNDIWHILNLIYNLFSTQVVARHDFMITFHETDYIISKSSKIIVHATELREMYHIVSSDSLVESKKVKLFAYYTLSNIELWYYCLEHAGQMYISQVNSYLLVKLLILIAKLYYYWSLLKKKYKKLISKVVTY
jgi:hypothetical protein